MNIQGEGSVEITNEGQKEGTNSGVSDLFSPMNTSPLSPIKNPTKLKKIRNRKLSNRKNYEKNKERIATFRKVNYYSQCLNQCQEYIEQLKQKNPDEPFCMSRSVAGEIARINKRILKINYKLSELYNTNS